ncbi:protein kinase domain-containing protein [Streptomyces nitrosporeus]|uniref:protein kinase domain-containing protein n=1 Tax=Streptomyces nitrosporeus TaxID=28894 RepID=UPI00331A95D0
MAAPDPLTPSDPPRIGPYTLLGRLGAGGMGAVYLGRSPGGRTVAVKLVRPDLGQDAVFRARFRAEVTAARAVSDAFTAPVVDADTEGPVLWMATAFVPGVSLGQAVRLAGPLQLYALGALAAGVAEALASIHAAGLTHRDLKPGNIMLALDGPHVIDFGIARAADGTALTETGMILGTPAYMSPEQATAGETGPASDVFSLGATLAFAARGSGVFDGGRAVDVLKRVVREEPDLSAVPEALRLLVAACLAKNPADRPTPRQIVGFVQRMAAPRPQGAWLPPALIAAIEEAAAVMAPSVTATPPPPATAPPVPSPPPYAPRTGGPEQLTLLQPTGPTRPLPPAGPSRRTLLIGAAGGAVALAGGGTALGLWLAGDGEPARTTSTDGAKPSGHPLTDPERSLDTGVTAKPRWTKEVAEPLVQIAGEDGTVVAFGAKHVWAFDAEGTPLWGPVGNITDPVGGGAPGLIAAVGDGMAYTVARDGEDKMTRTFRALSLADGSVAWKARLAQDSVTGLTVPGMLDGTVYLNADAASTIRRTGDPKKPVEIIGGPAVWAVDTKKRAFSWGMIVEDTDTKYPKGDLFVPSFGSRLLWATSDTDGTARKILGLDTGAKGRTDWEQRAPGGGGTTTDLLLQGAFGPWRDGQHSSAGGLFLHISDILYAIDPANGQTVWRSPKVAFKAVVADPDGRTVYAAANQGLGIVVYALDAADGKARWAGTLREGVSGVPVLQCADDTVYLCSGGRLWALGTEDGKARWTYELTTSLTTGAQTALHAEGGQVYAMNPGGLVALAAGS